MTATKDRGHVFSNTPLDDLWALLAELESQGVDLPYTHKLIEQVREAIQRKQRI